MFRQYLFPTVLLILSFLSQALAPNVRGAEVNQKLTCGYLLDGPVWQKFTRDLRLQNAMISGPSDLEEPGVEAMEASTHNVIFILRDISKIPPALAEIQQHPPTAIFENSGYIVVNGRISTLLKLAEDSNIVSGLDPWRMVKEAERAKPSEINLGTAASPKDLLALLSSWRNSITIRVKAKKKVCYGMHPEERTYLEGYFRKVPVVAVFGSQPLRITLQIISIKYLNDQVELELKRWS